MTKKEESTQDGDMHRRSSDAAENKLMTSVARSTSYNIVLQLMFRVLTFVINAVVLRYVSRDLIGVVNVRLTLLYSTILFIGREAFRKACLSKTEEKMSWQEIINIAWCSPIVGATAAMIFSYIWLFNLELPDPATIHSYGIGVVCFSISAIIEMMSEPIYIVAQKLFYVRFKALLEGIAFLSRCLVMLGLIIVYPDMGILAFCAAQLTFAVIYTSGYFLYFGYLASQNQSDIPFSSISGFLPGATGKEVYLNRHLLQLTWSFLKQSVLKQLLTEGERYVMTVFGVLSFAEQGVFDIVSNLGSLVARSLFLPIEDSSYLLFSQSIIRGIPAGKQKQDTVKMTTNVLSNLIKMLTIVGLTILVFGYSYSQLALHIYGGSLLSTGVGPYLLRWYCVYVLVLAINGITECFSFATMSQQALDRYNYKMLGFSVMFLVASLVFTHLFGSAGFIMANCCNLIARIIHSVYIIELFYSGTPDKPIKQSLLDIRIIVVYIFIFIITTCSEIYFGIAELSSSIKHVSAGLVCLSALLGVIYSYEKNAVAFMAQRFIKPLMGAKSD